MEIVCLHSSKDIFENKYEVYLLKDGNEERFYKKRGRACM